MTFRYQNRKKDDYIPPEGTVAMWPIGSNGTELTWNLQPETLMEKHRQHFLSFGKWDGEKRTGYYLSEGQEENFKNGLYNVVGQDDDGAYIIELKSTDDRDVRPFTIWNKKSHSASEYGTSLRIFPMKIRIVSRDHFLADGIGRHDMQMTSQIFFRERLFKILGQRTHLMCIGNKLMPLLGECDRVVDTLK